MPVINMKGKKCGRLKVIKRVKNDKYGSAKWKCKCECGNVVNVLGQALRSGHTKSCGCLQKDKVAKREYKHGYAGTKIYNVWYSMKARCTKKKKQSYKNYGGRGIDYCEEWEDPENFINWALNNGYEEGLTLERIDVNGNYTPDNCTFVTRAEQNRNTTRNIIVNINNKKMTLAELARKLDLSRGTLYRWYHKENLKDLELVFRYKNVPEKYKSEKGRNFLKKTSAKNCCIEQS